MCVAQPVSSARRIARLIASSSATTGRDCDEVAAARRVRARAHERRGAATTAGVLGVQQQDRAERGDRLHPLEEREIVDGRELVDPRVAHERLEAGHAALVLLGSRSTLPATRPPQSAKSTSEEAETAASFLSKDGPSTVTGMLLSGMST